MPAKEEEVKKYHVAAIGNAAIVEDQYSSLGPHSPFGFKISNQSAVVRLKSDDSGGCRWIVFVFWALHC